MAEFQPPEGLLTAVTKIVTAKWGPCDNYECEADRGDASDCTAARDTVADVLAALFEACEVREERRIVIDDEQVTGLWLAAAWAGDCDVLAATYSSGRVERHFVIETAPESVSSTGEEPTGG